MEGMRSYLRAHRKELDSATTYFLSLEAVGRGEVRYVTGEGLAVSFGMDPRMIELCDAIADTGGCAVAVEDDELLAALAETARLEGAFVCPEGAAGVAAIRRLRESGWIAEGDEVVLLNTGAGIKYPDTVAANPQVLQPGDAIPRR